MVITLRPRARSCSGTTSASNSAGGSRGSCRCTSCVRVPLALARARIASPRPTILRPQVMSRSPCRPHTGCFSAAAISCSGIEWQERRVMSRRGSNPDQPMRVSLKFADDKLRALACHCLGKPNRLQPHSCGAITHYPECGTCGRWPFKLIVIGFSAAGSVMCCWPSPVTGKKRWVRNDNIFNDINKIAQ